MDIKKFGHHIIDRLEPNEVAELLRNVKVVVGIVPAKLDVGRGVLVGDDGIQVIPDADMGNIHIERNRLGASAPDERKTKSVKESVKK